MNKKLIIIFSLLIVLVLILVLFCAIFVVSHITVTPMSVDLTYSESEIINSSKIKKGLSIFSLSEVKAKENIEKNFPLIKVVSVNRFFPNKVEIKIAKRFEIFSLEYNGVYLTLDKDLKVIDVLNPDENKLNNLVSLNNFIINDKSAKASDLIAVKLEDTSNGVIKFIVESAEKYNFIDEGFNGFFEHLTFDSKGYVILKTRLGISFAFQNIADESKIFNQFASCYSVFQKDLNDSQKKSDGYLVWEGGNSGWVWRATL